MERHAAFAILFSPGDFGTAETTAALNLYSLRAHFHGRGNCFLHGAPERNTAFKLTGYRVGHQAGIEFRFADFDDVQHDVFFGEHL
jgi:hypothetical protein